MNSFSQLKGRRFPFLGLVLAAIAGILIEDYFLFSGCFLFCSALFFLIVLLCNYWKNFFPLVLEQKIFFLFVAISFSTLHAWQWQESPARQLQSHFKNNIDDVAVEGVVASEVKAASNGSASFFLQVKKIAEMTLPIMAHVHWEGALPACGDHVQLRALPEFPASPRNPGEFNVAAWLARKEIYLELKMDPSNPGTILSSSQQYFLMKWAEASRHYVEKLITLGIADDSKVANIIQAIVLGAREQELVRVLSDFQLTGTMHLFAVSGLHVGMLAMIIWFFLKLLRLPRWSAALITIPLLFFYVAMTGFRIGSLRAVIMSSLILMGFLFYRRAQMLNNLAAAGFFLLLFETNLLFSIGWQFSFCVVLAILLLATPFQKKLQRFYALDPFIPKKLITPAQRVRYKISHHIAQLAAVSTAAWIGALLPTVFYFHLISFSSLGANVIAVPLAFMILALAVLSLAVGFFSPWAATVFNNTNWLCAKILLIAIHGCTLLPASSFFLHVPKNNPPRLVIFDFQNASAAVLQTEGKTWMIDAGRPKNEAQTLIPFLEERGITSLQGIIFTEKEAAHLGGIAPLLEKISSSSFFAAPGEGHSFLFKTFFKKLQASHQQLTMLAQGDHLDFSPHCFAEVLYPPVDSNDTSLVMKIHLDGATILLLPSAAAPVKTWLLEHSSVQELQSNILVLPDMDQKSLAKESLDDRFLKAVAPRVVIVGRNCFENKKNLSQQLSSSLAEQGIKLLEQEQAGAVIIEALPQKTSVRGFLNQETVIVQMNDRKMRLEKKTSSNLAPIFHLLSSK